MSMEIHQKTKNRSITQSSYTTPGCILEGIKVSTQRETYTPIFIAALFKIAKSWNQPGCLLIQMNR
jgi:hypothetical protein